MEEIRVASDTLEAVVLPEAGARLHRLRAYGHDVLRTPDSRDAHLREPFFWGAYVMAPWCNRIDAGPTRVGSHIVAPGTTFTDGSAMHGQVAVRPWDRVGDSAFRVRGGGDGWPWEYEVVLGIELVGPSLRLDLALTNHAPDPMPAGIGVHPWFRGPVRAAIHADAVYRSNTASEARPERVNGAFDLRRSGDMAAGLDATWTHLSDPPAELSWPTLGIRATMRIHAVAAVVVAASPAALRAIAVEPQTHAPQGLRRLLNGEPDPMTMLAPGETLRFGVELAFEQIDLP